MVEQQDISGLICSLAKVSLVYQLLVGIWVLDKDIDFFFFLKTARKTNKQQKQIETSNNSSNKQTNKKHFKAALIREDLTIQMLGNMWD